MAKLAGGLPPAAAAEVCAAAGAALRGAACAGPEDKGAGPADPDRALALAPQQLAVAECLAAGALRETGADAAAAVIGGWLPGQAPRAQPRAVPAHVLRTLMLSMDRFWRMTSLTSLHDSACAWEA